MVGDGMDELLVGHAGRTNELLVGHAGSTDELLIGVRPTAPLKTAPSPLDSALLLLAARYTSPTRRPLDPTPPTIIF